MNDPENTPAGPSQINTQSQLEEPQSSLAAPPRKKRSPRVPSGLGWSVGALLSLLVLVGIAGCKTSAQSPSRNEAFDQADPTVANYGVEPLREGDDIMIAFENITNLNTALKIPLSGYIDLPFIERVRAAGKTTMELQEELLRLYAPQVRADVITVKLVNADSSVYVSGAVLTPGKIPLDRPMTALDAIMEAGGFDPQKARMSKVVVLRVQDGQRRTYQLDLNKALKGDRTELFYLRPYDIVDVPVRTFNW
jgi:polysaccharide export outer membrane protein